MSGPFDLSLSGKEQSMRCSRFVMAGVLFLGLALVGTAGTDNAKKIVGVWELVKGEGPPGSTAEFTKDGKVKVQGKVKDKEFSFSGTYKIKDDKLTVTMKVEDKDITDTDTIKKLTDKELILEDDKGKVSEFKRVK
jgi:uncharacterized protein (TIGR03066 family)